MKRRTIELCKDIILVLLVANLILLALMALPTESVRQSPLLSAVLQPLAQVLGMDQAELAYMEVAEPVMDAARPLAVSLRNTAGRYTAIWDFAALDTAFETLGGALGEALDTAAAPTPVSQAQFQQALSGQSVYFAYGLTLPATVLASWLDAVPDESLPEMNACALAVEGDTVALYLLGEDCQKAETGLLADTLENLLEQFRPDGSAFAFEVDSSLSPYALLPGENPAPPGAVVGNPCDSRYVEALATALGFNPYGDTSYTDSSGTAYFSEAGCALQISPAGEILLTSTAQDRFQAGGDATEDLVEEARRLADLAAGDAAGEARLYLSDLTVAEGETVCTFDYYLSGIPIALGKGYGIQVTFSGQSVRRMEGTALRVETTGDIQLVMPVAQAAAVLPEGSDLTLEYQLQDGAMQAGWVPGR